MQIAPIDYRGVARVFAMVVWRYHVVYVGAVVVAVAVLQWIFNLEQLLVILFSDSGLPVAERLWFIAESIPAFYRYILDPVPLLIFLIAAFQVASLILVWQRRVRTQYRKSPLLLSMFSVGCVACGGSLLGPVFGVIGVSLGILAAALISQVLLGLAFLISLRQFAEIATVYTHLEKEKK